MLPTLKHQDTGKTVVAAKLLVGYLKISKKVSDPDSYIKVNGIFDADFVASVTTWQSKHNLTPTGEIDAATWTAIAANAPTCSTAKNTTSGYTMALQILLDGNLVCDGIYGSKTKAAVVALQSSNGLKADGICGPKTWSALICGKQAQPVTPGTFKQPVDYKQGDSRWGKKMYSNHNDASQTMANSGCGPTAMADVVATLIDPSVTPWTLAQLAMQWGDRTRNSGTAWSFFPHVADYYHFPKMVESTSWTALTACLDAGGYVVCSMAPGYWTKSGHFICAWKYDATYIYCNDPASSSRKKQKIADFKKERKKYFCFYPPTKEPEKPVEKPEVKPETPKPEPVKRGSKICDISKYQATVDYDKFIADTALIILRAGYRGTGGSVKEDECFEKHANALRQRGVRFGTYFYSLANTEEKAREEARMYWKWAKDYDPLFWSMDAEKDLITTQAIVAFVDELIKQGAKKDGCYVANQLYDKFDYGSIRNKMAFTWIPLYKTNPPAYKCDLWQYTSTGTVAGISGNVDLNKITGEGHDLAWFTDGAAPTPGGKQTVIITGSSVNVRDNPGTDSNILGVAFEYDALPYLGETKVVSGRDWYKVEFNGKNGWVSSKYSRIEG